MARTRTVRFMKGHMFKNICTNQKDPSRCASEYEYMNKNMGCRGESRSSASLFTRQGAVLTTSALKKNECWARRWGIWVLPEGQRQTYNQKTLGSCICPCGSTIIMDQIMMMMMSKAWYKAGSMTRSWYLWSNAFRQVSPSRNLSAALPHLLATLPTSLRTLSPVRRPVKRFRAVETLSDVNQWYSIHRRWTKNSGGPSAKGSIS